MVYTQIRIWPKNKTQYFLWDFEIRTDNLIPASEPELMMTTD